MDYPEEEKQEQSDKIYTIYQYNLAVQRYLKGKVPPIWVHGVITQMQIKEKIAYIQLAHFAEGDTRPKATLQVYLWTSELKVIQTRFLALPTPFEIRSELKVSVLLEADFYVPLGKFQPHIRDFDENFTLGELAQTRKKILEKLSAEGLLEKNKKCFLSPVPLRVGLITAEGSAAIRDFTTVLLNSGFSFYIMHYPATMQGERTENEVVRALAYFHDKDVDAVCIVRGGGSKTDLVYFDSEAICRSIANCPVPVFTGIGHEIDKSLADRVAYADPITPTGCAIFFRNRLQQASDGILAISETLKNKWIDFMDMEKNSLHDSASELMSRWLRRSSSELEKLKYHSNFLPKKITQVLKEEKRILARDGLGLQRGSLKMIDPHQEKWRNGLRSLRQVWKHRTQFALDWIETREKWVRSLDPKTIMQRGFGILRDGSGRWMGKMKGLRSGDSVYIEMHDGLIGGNVTTIEEKK